MGCSSARTALTNNGHYEGNTNSSCSRTSRTLRTGNYRNYLATIGGDETVPKLTVAKQVIEDFLNTVNGVRIGMMVFNYSQGGRIHSTIKSLDDALRMIGAGAMRIGTSSGVKIVEDFRRGLS